MNETCIKKLETNSKYASIGVELRENCNKVVTKLREMMQSSSSPYADVVRRELRIAAKAVVALPVSTSAVISSSHTAAAMVQPQPASVVTTASSVLSLQQQTTLPLPTTTLALPTATLSLSATSAQRPTSAVIATSSILSLQQQSTLPLPTTVVASPTSTLSLSARLSPPAQLRTTLQHMVHSAGHAEGSATATGLSTTLSMSRDQKEKTPTPKGSTSSAVSPIVDSADDDYSPSGSNITFGRGRSGSTE